MTISEFENNWQERINGEILKSFPDDFIDSKDCEIIKLPKKHLMKGSELFGSFEVIDTNGNPVLTSDSYDKVKFILYANKNLPSEINIPLDDNSINSSVKEYEKHLDDIIKLMQNDFKLIFPDSDKFISVSNKIFRLLNLHRF